MDALRSYVIPNVLRRSFMGKRLRDLPPEVWMIILDMTVIATLPAFKDCSSTDFPKLVRDWRTDRFPLNDEWGRLRLVCRCWSLMLNPRRESHLTHPPHKPHLRLTSPSRLVSAIGVRSVSFAGTSEWSEAEFKSYSLHTNTLSVTKNIVSISIGSSGSPEARSAFLDFIFTHSRYFPNVRSLAIDAWGYLVPEFWKKLQEAFPRLIALQIRGGHSARGEITLLNLEILILQLFPIPECNFPSLKHLWIGSFATGSHQNLLYSHRKTLESFVPGPIAYINSFGKDSFWRDFPNLRLFGGPVDILKMFDHPPPDHPFDHIWVYRGWIERSELTRNVVTPFPRLRYLSIDHGDRSSINTFVIRESYWRNGIRYIDGDLSNGGVSYVPLLPAFLFLSLCSIILAFHPHDPVFATILASVITYCLALPFLVLYCPVAT